MDICQLLYFSSAASMKNFTLAALENNISQSSFSKQIMNLENELGMKLFIRKKRAIELTPAGEHFLEYATKMLSTYNEMLRGMESYSAFQTLPVTIASIPVIQAYNLQNIIIELKQNYPDILFSLFEKIESSEVLHILHSGECDFAVLRTDFLNRSKYVYYPICKDRLCVVISDSHFLADKECISISELKECRFVMPPAESDLRRITQNACIAAGFRPDAAYITSGNVEISLDFVENENLCYLAFYDVIKRNVSTREHLRIIKLAEKIESFTAFVSLKSQNNTRAHFKVAQFLEERFPVNRLV